ncbi:MAG TPA: NAD+ synthase [Firmicutes bacterium]|nr:NAD+ synthase [Bacillota bacterium]
MKNRARICLCQINTVVGDIEGNCKKIIEMTEKAGNKQADLVVFPELAVTGYPPEDLLLKPGFVKKNMDALRKTAKKIKHPAVVAGFVNLKNGKIYNSAAFMSGGEIKTVYNKVLLPNYGVFDEKRYFVGGGRIRIIKINGVTAGISICEDIWQDNELIKKYKGKTDILINISASPYHKGKSKERFRLFSARAKELETVIYYVNQVGGQDELVFDGHSMVINQRGKLAGQGPMFRECMLYFDAYSGKKDKKNARPDICVNFKSKKRIRKLAGYKFEKLSPEWEVYTALVVGTRDYIIKNGFKKAVIALSGGVDSAAVAAIACDAIGPENVTLVYMPSKFSSRGSYVDSKKISENLGAVLHVIPMQDIVDLYSAKLKPFFFGIKPGVAEENIQARIRGNIIMAFSNKFGSIVLTTGNKSEMSTGYATLYGDMAGGFAVLKDVPKTLVYSICRERNKKAGFDIIPESILKKPPSAELRLNQKDTDSLPPYSVLDRIINDYVEKDRTYGNMKHKYNSAMLKRILELIDSSEYKRRQAPPGIKITPKAFGRDRRMPIINKFRD